jgi:hypothetical protein
VFINRFVHGKSPNVTIRWINGKSHRLSGTDMKALYEYLKLAFPEREHKGW